MSICLRGSVAVMMSCGSLEGTKATLRVSIVLPSPVDAAWVDELPQAVRPRAAVQARRAPDLRNERRVILAFVMELGVVLTDMNASFALAARALVTDPKDMTVLGTPCGALLCVHLHTFFDTRNGRS